MENFRLFFLVIVFAFAKTGEAQSTSFLINCGTNSSVTVNGRKWIGDLAPNSNITLSSTGIAASTDISSVDDSTYGELYKTARIFDSSLNYTVQGVRGDYFVRLHFSPLSFGDYNVNESSFGVEANGLKLVEKFEVPGEISQKNTYRFKRAASIRRESERPINQVMNQLIKLMICEKEEAQPRK